MADLSKITVQGMVVGRGAELRQAGSSTVASFSVVVNPGYKQDDKGYFIKVNIWGRSAENLAQYLQKGKRVLVTGTYKENVWIGQDGLEHKEAIIDSAEVFFQKGDSQNLQPKGPAPADYDDDIPF